jgi:outer membrane protein
MKLRRVFVAVAVVVMALPGWVRGEDLLQVYREAIAQDPALGAARAAWLATQERLPQARAGLRPQVSASAAANGTLAGVDVISSPRSNSHNEFLNLNATVSASQPLYRRQTQIAIDQAVQALDQSDVVLMNSQQDLILRVAQAYFDVLFAQDNITLIEAQKVATAELLAQAKRNFEVGTATITDTNEAQARYDQIIAQEIAFRAEREFRRSALRAIIGRLPDELAPLGPRFSTRLLAIPSVEEWIQRAQTNNFAVRSARVTYDIATLEIERNRAARDPVVDLVGSLSAGYGSGSLASNADAVSRQGVIGVQVSVPLYTGGLIDSRVREAIAARDRARQELENARRAAALQIQQAYLGVTAGSAALQAFEQALISAESAVESNRLGREVGVRTNLDVLQVESTVFQVRRDVAQARYNWLMSGLRLWAAAGELDETKLARINLVLGP